MRRAYTYNHTGTSIHTQAHVHIHTQAQAVDMVLAGGQAAGQVRERTPEGDILTYKQVCVW
jgi:hypothetical protein